MHGHLLPALYEANAKYPGLYAGHIFCLFVEWILLSIIYVFSIVVIHRHY